MQKTSESFHVIKIVISYQLCRSPIYIIKAEIHHPNSHLNKNVSVVDVEKKIFKSDLQITIEKIRDLIDIFYSDLV